MAGWDDDYHVPDDWNPVEAHIFDELIDHDSAIGSDQYLQALFDEALFDNIHGHGGPEHDFLMDSLVAYLADTYGIEFDDVFDWEGWREWYDSV